MLIKIYIGYIVGFEQNSAIVLVMLDVSTAFHTVDIRKLLRILENKIKLEGAVLNGFRLVDTKKYCLRGGDQANFDFCVF